MPNSHILDKIQALEEKFLETTKKLKKDITRYEKIIVKSDKRQQQDYD